MSHYDCVLSDGLCADVQQCHDVQSSRHHLLLSLCLIMTVYFQTDFVLMCNNAMTYNRPDTIYYKEAKRLLQSAMKLMSKVLVHLIHVQKNLGKPDTFMDE